VNVSAISATVTPRASAVTAFTGVDIGDMRPR
jgi:hypothetical protein